MIVKYSKERKCNRGYSFRRSTSLRNTDAQKVLKSQHNNTPDGAIIPCSKDTTIYTGITDLSTMI